MFFAKRLIGLDNRLVLFVAFLHFSQLQQCTYNSAEVFSRPATAVAISRSSSASRFCSAINRACSSASVAFAVASDVFSSLSSATRTRSSSTSWSSVSRSFNQRQFPNGHRRVFIIELRDACPQRLVLLTKLARSWHNEVRSSASELRSPASSRASLNSCSFCRRNPHARLRVRPLFGQVTDLVRQLRHLVDQLPIVLIGRGLLVRKLHNVALQPRIHFTELPMQFITVFFSSASRSNSICSCDFCSVSCRIALQPSPFRFQVGRLGFACRNSFRTAADTAH